MHSSLREQGLPFPYSAYKAPALSHDTKHGQYLKLIWRKKTCYTGIVQGTGINRWYGFACINQRILYHQFMPVPCTDTFKPKATYTNTYSFFIGCPFSKATPFSKVVPSLGAVRGCFLSCTEFGWYCMYRYCACTVQSRSINHAEISPMSRAMT